MSQLCSTHAAIRAQQRGIPRFMNSRRHEMLKLIFASFITTMAMLTTDAHAWGSLQSQEVNGFASYCTYSDGGVLTVGSAELCPIDNSSGAENGGAPSVNIENRNGGFGSLTSQRVNGFNRYCSYSDGAVLTVGSTELCPITDQ